MRTVWLAALAAGLALVTAGCNCNVQPVFTIDGGGGGEAGGNGGVGGGSGNAGGSPTAGGAAGGTSCTGATRCYPFPAGTPGQGACQQGTQQCVGGFLGPCIGAVGPSAEACNNVDDDCNGMVDDGLGTVSCGIGGCRVSVATCTNGQPTMCTPGTPMQESCANTLDDDCDGIVNDGCNCIYVAPTGADTNTGDQANPVRHIAVAQDIAADAGVTSVCVAAGSSCGPGMGQTFDYGAGDAGEAVVMRNGISLLGGYRSQSNNPPAPGPGSCDTRITAQSATGVLFDRSISLPTSLDGFSVQGGNFATSAGVTVQASTGAIVNNCIVTGGTGSAVTTSVGVDVTDVAGVAATPLISRSQISGGAVSGTAIGIRSTGSAPVVVGNCTQFDAQGRCTSGCGAGQDSIRGFVGGIAATPTTTAYAIDLIGSPRAEIDSSAVCATTGMATVTNAAGVHVSGDATGVRIRRSSIASFTASANSVGVWADPCRGASPTVFDNQQVAGTSNVPGSRSDGVRAIGACHVVIDSNRSITGGVEQAGQDTNGVYCALDRATGVASQCTVLANQQVLGSNSGFPPRSVGVRCDDGACARIEGNGLISGRGGVFSAGVQVSRAGPFIARNVIAAGCANQLGIGLLSSDAWPRVENNVIRGVVASGAVACLGQTAAVRVLNGASTNEIELHSNTLFAEGLGACTGQALGFDVADGGTAMGPRGIVRNNILASGGCATRYGLHEMNAAADPKVVENNDFFSQPNPGAVLYRDEATVDLLDAGQVNALTDVTASGNIAGNPNLGGGGGFHLAMGSICINAGTDAGAPRADFDREARPSMGGFDIGADELP